MVYLKKKIIDYHYLQILNSFGSVNTYLLSILLRGLSFSFERGNTFD